MKLNPFRKESPKRYSGTDKRFAKTLGAFDLLTIGIGAVIGTGVFTLPGTAAVKEAGPGVTLSFLVVVLVYTLASMCYMELSPSTPVAGSAYSYGGILYGEVIDWISGWALVLGYMLSVAVAFVGWTSYSNSLFHSFGLHIPHRSGGPFDPLNGTYLNLWAVISALLIGILLSRGVKTSMKFNNAVVLIKAATIPILIGVGLFFIKPKDYRPLIPRGTTGALRGATMVFFVFLGFDAASSSAAEIKSPKKNTSVGITGILIAAALLYMGVLVVLIGMVNYKQLDVANPIAYALKLVNQGWIAGLLSIGTIVGVSIVMLTMIYSSSRLIYPIGRDGLLLNFLGKIDKHGLPENAFWIVIIAIALMDGLFSLGELTNPASIRTLLASTLVSFGVILLRRRKDIPEGSFKVPLHPVTLVLSGLACIGMICFLSAKTYLSAGIWFLFGLLIYCAYGYEYSKISKKNN